MKCEYENARQGHGGRFAVHKMLTLGCRRGTKNRVNWKWQEARGLKRSGTAARTRANAYAGILREEVPRVADGQKTSDGRRAPAFTAETAREAGSRGGKASGQARRQKRALKDAVGAVMGAKVLDENTVRALREAGYITGKGKPTVRLAIAANMAGIAMNPAPSTTAGSAIKAAIALAQIESGEIGTPPPSLRDLDSEGVGGVVMMPSPDPSLLREPDEVPAGAEESETSEGDEP